MEPYCQSLNNTQRGNVLNLVPTYLSWWNSLTSTSSSNAYASPLVSV